MRTLIAAAFAFALALQLGGDASAAYYVSHIVDATTNASGAATVYTSVIQHGQVVSISYLKDGTTPFDNGVDFTVTLEATGQAVWTGTDVNATTTVYPLAAATKTDGTASTLSEVPIVAVGERAKIVVAQGGNVKLGRFIVKVGG